MERDVEAGSSPGCRCRLLPRGGCAARGRGPVSARVEYRGISKVREEAAL